MRLVYQWKIVNEQILIIEDEEALCASLSRVLSREGCGVELITANRILEE